MRLRVLARLSLSCVAVLLSACVMFSTEKQAKPYEAFVYLDRTIFVFPYADIFKFQTSQFTEHAASDLEDVVRFAKQHASMHISITVYTDDALNSLTSMVEDKFAASAVAAFLWSEGVTNTMEYSAHTRGSHFVSSNRSAQIGKVNRRVEVEFSYG